MRKRGNGGRWSTVSDGVVREKSVSGRTEELGKVTGKVVCPRKSAAGEKEGKAPQAPFKSGCQYKKLKKQRGLSTNQSYGKRASRWDRHT